MTAPLIARSYHAHGHEGPAGEVHLDYEARFLRRKTLRMTDGREVFFDRASVTGEGWEQLDLNCEITFSLMQGEKGLYAANVTLSG